MNINVGKNLIEKNSTACFVTLQYASKPGLSAELCSFFPPGLGVDARSRHLGAGQCGAASGPH